MCVSDFPRNFHECKLKPGGRFVQVKVYFWSFVLYCKVCLNIHTVAPRATKLPMTFLGTLTWGTFVYVNNVWHSSFVLVVGMATFFILATLIRGWTHKTVTCITWLHKCHMTSYKCHMTSYKCHMTILDQRRATWEKKKILLLPIRKHCMVSSFLRNVMNRNWKLKVSAHIEVHHCYTSQMIYHCGGEPEQAVHCWFNVMALKPWICVHVHLIRTQLYVLWSLTRFHRAYVTANPAAMHCLCATTKY